MNATPTFSFVIIQQRHVLAGNALCSYCTNQHNSQFKFNWFRGSIICVNSLALKTDLNSVEDRPNLELA